MCGAPRFTCCMDGFYSELHGQRCCCHSSYYGLTGDNCDQYSSQTILVLAFMGIALLYSIHILIPHAQWFRSPIPHINGEDCSRRFLHILPVVTFGITLACVLHCVCVMVTALFLDRSFHTHAAVITAIKIEHALSTPAEVCLLFVWLEFISSSSKDPARPKTTPLLFLKVVLAIEFLGVLVAAMTFLPMKFGSPLLPVLVGVTAHPASPCFESLLLPWRSHLMSTII